MKSKMKWYVLLGITVLVCLSIFGVFIPISTSQRDKIEELENKVNDMYIIEDSEVFAVNYENNVCYVWYGDQMLKLQIVDRILHTDIRKGDIAYFITNHDFTETVLVAIQHYDD